VVIVAARASELRVRFLLVRRTPPGLGPVLSEVYERLCDQGVAVDDVIPEEQLLSTEELAVRHDLYVLKSHTELALSTAGTLCALGARLLNPHQGCLLTQDKITSTKLLSDAGVPVPRSWVTDDYARLLPLLSEGPLIAKPHRGHLGRGIRVLRRAEDLELLSSADGPFLFQRYLETGGEDVKAYVVGDRVFAVTKRFSSASYRLHGTPMELDAGTRDAVLRCGRVLGLYLYGVDLVRTERGAYVVDVNYFPGYKGVPGAAKLIADYVYQYAVADPRPVLEGAAL
jgi:ribosomal protein S6--L-glutamate ligase